MGTNKTLSVFLKLNSEAFTSGLKQVEGKLNKFGKKIGNVGSSLTTGVSLPLIGIGAAAVKTASEFESSMTKIQTLVGLPKDAVDQLSDSVLNLAGETATAPNQLAEGLYFLTSAGLDGESALRALEATAKGSAAGLGDMEALATVAAAAQNAYGEEVLSSSQALDIFGTMVQTGMFKSEELANVLGSQLGLASNLGISMEELGSMISTYTRTTGSATDATTGLSGIMMSFAKITPKAADALAKATQGLEGGAMSADDLRTMLGEQGLQQTLMFLQEQFNSAGIPLSEFFSKSQALKGVLGVLGTQTESYTEILGSMEDAQGFVNDAFDETSQTSAFKFKQAMADLQVAGVKLGESLMPVATKLAGVFSKMAKTFSSLSEETREKIVKIGLALVAIGPTLMIIGKLTTAFGFVVKVVRMAGRAIISAGKALFAMGPAGLIIGAIVAAVGLLIKNWEWTKKKIVEVVNGFIDLYNESMLFKVAVETLKFAFKTVWDYIKFMFGNVKTVLGAIGGAIEDVINFRNPAPNFKKAMQQMGDDAKAFANKTKKNWDDALNNIQSKEKVEFITEEDVDRTLGKVKNGMDNIISTITGAGGGVLDDLMGGGDEGVDPVELNGVLNIDDINLGDGEGEVDEEGNPIIKIKGSLDTEEMQETLSMLEQQTSSAFEQMANSQDGGLGAMVQQTKSAARDIIKTKIAEGTASWAASALKGLPWPANAILAATAGIVVGGIFNAIIPPFAEGGIVSGPTLAYVGEGSGTSAINPEVIAPLDKLKGMIGGVGGGLLHGTISGSDILLSNTRSTISQDRVSGSATNF
tara:strand:+ start:14440 stop:16878 length:2439 start_codon:yes stop_codon:yes gene_type:complete